MSENLIHPAQHIAAALKFLHPAGGVFEICAIGLKRRFGPWEGQASGRNPIVAGWFKDQKKAADLAMQIQAEAVYVGLNPCHEALMARAHERLKANVSRSADHNIIHLSNLLLDFDPQRPSGVSSSDQEHEVALQIAKEIKAELAAEGWPDPLVGDSGNGSHLIYPLPDLANAPRNIELLKGVLEALSQRFEERLADGQLDLDLKVYNPSRLCKLYGTMTRKGDSLPSRPHRLSRIIELPLGGEPVSRELLQKVVDSAASKTMLISPAAPPPDGRFDLASYLAHYGVKVLKVKEFNGGQLHCLEECLFDPSHGNNEAAIGQAADGKLFYQCFHASCRKRTWAEARAIMSQDANLGRFVGRAPGAGSARRGLRIVGGGTLPAARVAESPGREPVTEVFSWSDAGNSKRVRDAHGRDIHFCHKKWLVWNDNFWEVDKTGEVMRRVQDTIAGLFKEAQALEPNSDQQKKLTKFALKSEDSARLNGVLNLLKSEPGISILPAALDANPWLLNSPGGTIDLTTALARPPAREDLLTRMTSVPPDPEAKCPQFLKFLYETQDELRLPLVAARMVPFLQNVLGYTLTGSIKEQSLFILWGQGANGKSTLLNIIKEIMGSYAVTTSAETLLAKSRTGSIPNDVARLDGPRLVTSAEVDRGRRLAESLVKELTGGDMVSARFMYSEWFDFRPQFKLFLCTNNRPVIRGGDHAIWRRIRMIPFSVRFGEGGDLPADPDLADRLRSEAPGILTWMLKGCLRWQREGLRSPERVQAALIDYRNEMDPLLEFIEDCCIVSKELTVSASDIYEAYCKWADRVGLKDRDRLKKKSLGTALLERGFERDRIAGVRLWRGLGLGFIG